MKEISGIDCAEDGRDVSCLSCEDISLLSIKFGGIDGLKGCLMFSDCLFDDVGALDGLDCLLLFLGRSVGGCVASKTNFDDESDTLLRSLG